jgi:hypothetical protein
VPRLLREHERGTDARLEDGGGRGAIRSCARQLERADEKTEERCSFGPAHLHASPLRQAFDQDVEAEPHLGRERFASRKGMPRNLGGESGRWAAAARRIAMLGAQVGADG